jgi:osmotically-inducible protein OsmY
MNRHLSSLLIGVNVDTDQGVVTLHGQVETQAERQLAVMVARDVNGAKDVVNDITVR